MDAAGVNRPNVDAAGRSHRRGAWRWGPGLAALCLAALASCSEKPLEPRYENVFDLLGPDGGDPFEIAATLERDGVHVSFRQVQPGEVTAAIQSYGIYRLERGTYSDLDAADPDSAIRLTYVDADYLPNAENTYKVQVRTAENAASSLDPIQPAGVATPPRIETASGLPDRTPTRYLQLRVESLPSETLEVASSRGFEDALAVDLDETTSLGVHFATLPWDLGPALQNDIIKVVYVRPQNRPEASKTDSLRLAVDFRPAVTPPGGTSVSDTTVVLEITPTLGITRMRFADTQEQLALAAWDSAEAGSDTITVTYQLSAQNTTPKVFAELDGDFGFSDTTRVDFQAQAVGEAVFALDGGAEFTAHPERRVTVESSVEDATQMRFSESLDFSQVEWIDYQEDWEFQLSEGLGEKTVYGWYRNPFDLTGQVASQRITLVGEAPPP